MKIKIIGTVLIVVLIGTLIFAGLQNTKLKESQNQLTLVQDSLAKSYQTIEMIERDIDAARQQLLAANEQLRIAFEELDVKP